MDDFQTHTFIDSFDAVLMHLWDPKRRPWNRNHFTSLLLLPLFSSAHHHLLLTIINEMAWARRAGTWAKLVCCSETIKIVTWTELTDSRIHRHQKLELLVGIERKQRRRKRGMGVQKTWLSKIQFSLRCLMSFLKRRFQIETNEELYNYHLYIPRSSFIDSFSPFIIVISSFLFYYTLFIFPFTSLFPYYFDHSLTYWLNPKFFFSFFFHHFSIIPNWYDGLTINIA